jgi:hypothetical protein
VFRWAAALAISLSLAVGARAGTLVSAGDSGVGAAAQLTDTYFIFPDNQMMTWIETDAAFSSPWGAIGGIPAATDIEQIMNWVCTNRDTHNIKAVLHMGDAVRRGAQAAAWAPLNDAVDILDACDVPFVMAVGNHELQGISSIQNPDDQNNAEQYHLNQGETVMDVKGWFAGSRAQRPDWIECVSDDDGDGVCTAGGDTVVYLEDTDTYASRSFWVPIPPLNIMVPEWDYSIKLSDSSWSGPVSPAEEWTHALRITHPNDYWLHVTHAGPCDVPQNCDLTPRDLGRNFGPQGGDWSPTIHGLGPNVVGFLNGHWNAGGLDACNSGGGVYATGSRSDGSPWLAAGFDMNCGVRQDPQAVAGNVNFCPDDGIADDDPCTAAGAGCNDCDTNPYTWSGWLQVKRSTRQICVDTIRVIDVDTNNDGTPDAGAATILTGSEEFDRGTTYTNHPTAGEGLCNTGTNPGDGDSGPVTGCPNDPETCITITNL